jgi:DNA-binding XRE family transcriptional regulator
MVNTDDFIKRLEIILDYYSLNASSFADKIGAQRSSMSHLLSGRNKPSLDFILKIVDFFPDVDLYWLLIGKGTFPINPATIENLNSAAFDSNIAPAVTSIDLLNKDLTPIDLNTDAAKTKQIIKTIANESTEEIEKIVFFYKNGAFKIYSPN